MTSELRELRNTYFVMRHGRSLANEQELIVSDFNDAALGYRLTEEGRAEVKKSAEYAKEQKFLDDSTVIVSSDFARARETAEIVASVLGVKDVALHAKLRERFFGEWEKTHNSNYQKVWDADNDDYTHKDRGVESVADVLERGISLVEELEEKYSRKNILLVSHGDTLQILQTAFEKVHPSRHRSLVHLRTAEIRLLN